MSDYAIKVENLGKAYTIRHQQPQRYATLRDVMADRTEKGVWRLMGRHAALLSCIHAPHSSMSSSIRRLRSSATP